MNRKLLGRILALLILVPLFLFVVLSALVTFYPARTVLSHKLPVGVVFGAGITRSGVPSPALKFRLDKSVELYRGGWIKRIFLSGRKPEIIVMMLYLKRQGIPQDSLYLDYSGYNTSMTVSHVSSWMHAHDIDGAAMISQRYHLPRIQFLSWKAGIKGVSVVSSDYRKVSFLEKLKFVMRETFAILKEVFLKGNTL